MITFLKIAWRNITRNRRRSLITVSAIGFGLGALIFIWSFVEGAHQQMINNFTSLAVGHIQIHHQGFHQHQRLEDNLVNSESIRKNLEAFPNISASTSRLKAFGLASSAESSSGVLIVGIQPASEKNVSVLHQRVKQGEFIDENSPDGIVIGAALAKNLNLLLGDKIILMSQALDGSIASGAFRIKGLLDTGTDEIDKNIALINLTAAQEMFVMPQKVSEIAIKLKKSENAQKVADEISQKFNEPGLEVLSWPEISPSFYQWIEFDNAFIWLIFVIFMVVVAIGILNTVLMGVLERTREFGILLALGTRPKEIVIMVAWESVILGCIGCVSGTAVGYFLTAYFGTAGINLSIFTSALNSFYMDPIIFPKLQTSTLGLSISLVMVTSLLVSIYPAWHAAHLKPVEAIRSM
jgi:ABC-type lipoprotein release transport system permease subunit